MIIELMAYGIRDGRFLEIIKEYDYEKDKIISESERELCDAEANEIINKALDENNDLS